MEFHEHASIFPMMTEAEFKGLVEDIREHGLRDPIITLDGKILDGRNRWRACEELGIEAKMVEFDNGAPIAFIISHNLHRRHLNESQRAMIAARLASRTADDQRRENLPGAKSSLREVPTNDEAAKMLNVSRAAVSEAKAVLRKGTPEEVKAIDAGEMAVTTTARRIRANLTPEQRKQKQKNPNALRIQNLRANAQLWGMFRDAITNLSGLPNAEDMIRIVKANDKARITDPKLPIALKWLEEFSNVWNRSRNEASKREAA